EDRTFLPRARKPASDCPAAQTLFSMALTLERVQRAFVHSFGCRASQADGAAIEASLKERGFDLAADAADADLVVLNTCTVTREADADARGMVRAVHRERPEARILVTGCYAQRAAGELATLAGVHWVVGNSHKTQIAEIVEQGAEAYHGQVLVSDISEQREFLAAPIRDSAEERTRPNLKVQDGCGNRGSFCVIPSVRGRSRSAPLASVMEQMHDLAGRYAEIVLSGINLGRWGRDFSPSLRFADLLRAILRETPVQRLRISSVEPMDWSEELFSLIANEPRIARHVHLPLQSGSDAVLKRMFRKYRTRHYAGRLELAHRLMPEAAIGADVMTGFPGETEAEFDETMKFIEQHPFTYLHVFTYSERPGTAAAERGDQVPMHIRRERTRALREISERKNLEFRRGMLGKTLSAVTLDRSRTALSTNFLRIEMTEPREANRIVDLRIGAVGQTGLRERELLPVLLDSV
ncbi:MAG: tRNA (N(6)-L-threonylcarbamoyladenosine(37)-C(2))-methylthiotransferase MtaB, partial [Bryobacteraceae bacterium]